LFDCTALIYQKSFAPLVDQIRDQLPKLAVLVCLETELEPWLAGIPDEPWHAEPPDDVVMIAGTGGTTGRPKGVVLNGANLEAMTSIVLLSYPFQGRPVYLALAPLTHAAGVLCFPMLALGGQIVVLRKPDLGDFLDAIARYRVTHTFLPPTLIYLLLDNPELGPRTAHPCSASVRGGPNVHCAAGASPQRHRTGHGPAVRPDRSADDDLNHGTRRAFP
jgi:acyl-CoA synthetase (AMP-forming)/AMP-acid ligase II